MKKILITITLFSSLIMAQTKYSNLNIEINKGNFLIAKEMINNIIEQNIIGEKEKDLLLFEIERHERIKKDFTLSKDEVLEYVRKYIPNADENWLHKWEADGSLEYKIIDGTKYYFYRSHTNLFRINEEAKLRKELIAGKSKDNLRLLLENLVPQIESEIDSSESIYGLPNRIKLNYKLSVKSNVVPEGERIRCWLPYPKEGHERQELLEFSTNGNYKIANDSCLQRSVYIEKTAIKDQPTIFEYELILSNKSVYFNVKPELIKPYFKNSEVYKKHTSERLPHIVFTDKIKTLSAEIIGNENNSYQIAKKIFTWISNNIPWAGAREYSTILNISDYCITNMHGDCGIKTLLFMTLARYNGIPTKWQSGWMLHPGEKNLHDWCEVYFEGYGWVPVDQSFGIIDAENEKVKFFYLGGMDQYRFIVNDDFSTEFSPPKEHSRSETVDFQRGEVEWAGGNLYFDKWNYSMKIEYLD
jgi:Transglutaminase-like superfamily